MFSNKVETSAFDSYTASFDYQLSLKANSIYVDTLYNNTVTELNTKATITQLETFASQYNTILDSKANVNYVDQQVATKADLIGGKIPASQLPSFVDDVLDGFYVNTTTFNDIFGVAYTPADGVIYVDISTNKTYRWGGSSYVTTGGGGVALGETAATAYRGDRGKEAYDHSQSQGNPHNTTTSEITEGTNKYFTDLRVRNTVLSGLVKTDSSNVTNADTIEVAVGKLAAKSEAGGSGGTTTWVSATSIGTVHPNIVPANNFIELARIDGMLWIRGSFKNTGGIIYESQPHLLKIDDIQYKVLHRNSTSTLLSEFVCRNTLNNKTTIALGASANICLDAASAATCTQYFTVLTNSLTTSSSFYHIPPTCLGELVIK